MLIVFSGLPGTGKTSIAKLVAANLGATYLRIDTIEQGIRNAGVPAVEIGASGYRIAMGIAAENCRIGRSVVADCVNPVSESRQAWADLAAESGVDLKNIEVVCSDRQEHRRRVEQRHADIPGLVPPAWQSVLEHEYELWCEPRLMVDTASLSAAQAADLIAKYCAELVGK